MNKKTGPKIEQNEFFFFFAIPFIHFYFSAFISNDGGKAQSATRSPKKNTNILP